MIILEIFGDFSQEGCYFKLFWRLLRIFWPFLKSKGFSIILKVPMGILIILNIHRYFSHFEDFEGILEV